MLPPAQSLPFAATTTDITLLVGAAILIGWSFTETGGVVASEVALYDGASTAGVQITDVTLSAGQSTRDYVPGHGLLLRTGLFLDAVAGTTRGTIWFVPLTTNDDLAWAHGEYGVYHVRPGT